MAHRINERNAGQWSIDSEPKHVSKKQKKVSRSFSYSEIQLFGYLMDKIASDLELDASDLDNQVFKNNGDALIVFSRDRIEDFRSLIEKFK